MSASRFDVLAASRGERAWTNGVVDTRSMPLNLQTPVDGRHPNRIAAILSAIGAELRAAEVMDPEWPRRQIHVVIKPAEYPWSPYSHDGDLAVITEMEPWE